MLVFFMGLFGLEPLCIKDIDQVKSIFLLSIFNTVTTCIFLAKVNNCRQKLKDRHYSNIREFNQNGIPMEVQQNVTNECNEDRPPSYSELFPPTSQEN
jgi:hypothetical protein